MKRVFYLVLGTLFVFTACEVDRGSSEGEVIDDLYTEDISTSSVQQAIDEQYQVLMHTFQERDYDSLSTVYNEIGWMIPPEQEAAEGRGDIKDYMEAQADSGFTRIQFSSRDLTFADSLSAVETGIIRLFKNDQQVDEGDYLAYWRNEGDAWRIYRQVWNSRNSSDEKSDTTETISQ